MTTQHKDPRAVIEQLVEALEVLNNLDADINLLNTNKLEEMVDAALTAGRDALKLRTCTWTQHDDVHMPSTYETECGALWSFVEGGPSENKTKFCHGCGGLVCEPIVGLQSVHDAITDDPSLCDPEPSTAGEPRPVYGKPGTRDVDVAEAMKRWDAAHAQPAQGERTSEHHFAIREGHQIAAVDEYFAARPQIDNNDRRKVYEAGFNRGFEAGAALLQSTPDARPVGELTDEQIEQAVKTYGVSWTGYREDKHGFYTIPILSPYHYQFARAILAAARTQPERDRQ